MSVDELKKLVKNTTNKDNYIVSQYTSPLYLANLKLCEMDVLRPMELPAKLSFKVLEKQSDLDHVLYD